jgi:WD40 repeat protein
VVGRLAQRVKKQRGRRQQREQTVAGSLDQIAGAPTMRDDPPTQVTLSELGTLLDQELQRLPAAYREALVLCCMEGLSHVEAAEQLGWPLGTFKGRLQRGRNLLRQRLGRRGVALSIAGLSMVLAGQTGSAAPAALVRATIRAVVRNTVSARVAALADRALSVMTVGKVKLALFGLLAVGLLGYAGAALPFKPASATTTPDPVFTATQVQQPPVAKDLFDDPLPPGAVVRLGTVRWRHGAPVHFLAILPDAKTVVSAADDRFVRVWDLATGKELQRFGPGPQPENPVLANGPVVVVPSIPWVVAAVSHDGKLVAARFDQGDIQLWETATGKKVGTVPVGKDNFQLAGLAFAPNGKHLALVANGPVRLWDLEAGKVVRAWGQALKNPPGFLANPASLARYAPDGKMFVSVESELDGMDSVHHLKFWDPQTAKELRSIKVPTPFGLIAGVFSPDSKLFAYATPDAGLVLLRADTGEQLHQWKAWKSVDSAALAFAADSTKLYCRTLNLPLVQEWDVTTAKLLRKFPALFPATRTVLFFPGGHSCLAASPDGKTLATGGAGNCIAFIDLQTGKEVPLAGSHYHLLEVGYTADGKELLTRDDAGTLNAWEAVTGKQLGKVSPKDRGFMYRASRDGRYAVNFLAPRGLVLSDKAAGKEIATIPIKGTALPLYFFSPDSRTLLVRHLDENVAVLYDSATGKERCRVPVDARGGPGPSSGGGKFIFAPDGQRVAVYPSGKGFMVHDARTGKAVKRIVLAEDANVRGGALSPDGRTLAIDLSDGTVQLFELATGKQRASYGQKQAMFEPSGTRQRGPFAGALATPTAATVAFSPDGRLLAHVGLDHALYVWDGATGQTLARFVGHTGSLGSLAFAPDGRTLATASGDTTALIWDVQGAGAKAGPKPHVLDAAAVQAHWKQLVSEDGPAAHTAVNALVASPQQTMAFLKTHLQPTATTIDTVSVEKLLGQLDSADFKVRQQSQEDLLKLGEQVVPHIEKALAGKITLERQRRLEQLHAELTTAAPLDGSRLQVVRAIEVLERIGSADARLLLGTLADGAPGALATLQARAALARLKK